MPSKNKPNGYWTFKTHHWHLGYTEDEIGGLWKDLSNDLKTEWKEYAKNGGAPPQGYNSVRIPEPTSKAKKTKKPESKHKPDTSSLVDQESMIYNPHLSRDVQAMIDERKAVLEEKNANVRKFSATLPGPINVEEAKAKQIVFIHMFPLYDGDEKSYNRMQWHPSIIYATRFSLETGVTHQYHAFTVADDVMNHVERAQMLNEGRCQVLHGADRMATGPRLPIKGVHSASITGEMFPDWQHDYCVIINNLANLIFVDGFDSAYFGNVIFAYPMKTQTPDLEDNWMMHCLEQELMLRRLLMQAKAAVKTNAKLSAEEVKITQKNIERLEGFRIQPLGYYWCTLHAVKIVEDVKKDDERRKHYVDMIQETRILIGRRQASLVVRPYMKCEYHATEDNKVCMPAEGRSILTIMFSDLLSKYEKIINADAKFHTFMGAEDALRNYVKKNDRTIDSVFSFEDNEQLPLFPALPADTEDVSAWDGATVTDDSGMGSSARAREKRSSSSTPIHNIITGGCLSSRAGSADLFTQRKVADELIHKFAEMCRNKVESSICEEGIGSAEISSTFKTGDQQELEGSTLLKPSVAHTPPVSLVTTPAEPAVDGESTVRLTRSRTAKVAPVESVAEHVLENELLDVRSSSKTKRTARRRGMPVGLEDVVSVCEEKPELLTAPVVADSSFANEIVAQEETAPAVAACSVDGVQAHKRRGRPKKVAVPPFDDNVQIKDEPMDSCEETTSSPIADRLRRRKISHNLDLTHAGNASNINIPTGRRRGSRPEKTPTFDVTTTATELSSDNVPAMEITAVSETNGGDAEHLSSVENTEERIGKRGRPKKCGVRTAKKVQPKKRPRRTWPLEKVESEADEEEVVPEDNVVAEQKMCPNCPDVPCTKQHLLAVHNNIHPDEYLLVRTQRTERRKRWMESVAAGYKLRCQNEGCAKQYTTPEGLQYHLTNEGLCLAPAHLRALFTDPEPVKVDDESEEKPPPVVVEYDDANGRPRRSAAMRAVEHIKQVLVDERRSDRAAESAAAADVVIANDADEPNPFKRLMKRRRRDGSRSSVLRSEFSCSSRSDDGSYAEGMSDASSTESEIDDLLDEDETNDDDMPFDDNEDEDAGVMIIGKRIPRDKKMSRLLTSNHQASARSMPSKSRRRVDQGYLIPRIYQTICRSLWQRLSNVSLRRPTDKLLQSWRQAVNLTGVCVCRVCGHESRNVEDGVTHFISCEKAQELHAFYSADEYEVRTVENLLRCRLCVFTQEGCDTVHLDTMAEHCARLGGAHSQLLNHIKFQSLIHDLLSSGRLQMDGCRTRELTDSVAKAAIQFLVVPEQREKMLNAEFSTDRLREKVAAYQAKVTLLQRARQDELVRSKLHETTTAADDDDKMVVDEEDASVNNKFSDWLRLCAPVWLSRLHAQLTDLSAWSNLSSLSRNVSETLVSGTLPNMCSPAFCTSIAENNQNSDTTLPAGKKQTTRLFDVCQVAAADTNSSDRRSNNAGVQLSFIGGNVTAVCWLPQTVYKADDASVVCYQILAVTVERPKLQSNFEKSAAHEDVAGPSTSIDIDRCVQFWRVRRSRMSSHGCGTLEFAGAIACEYGAVRALAFLPQPAIADPSKRGDFTLLAVATESGICPVYLLCLSDFAETEPTSRKLFLLPPLMLLSLPRHISDASALLPTQSVAGNDADLTALEYEPFKFSSLAWQPNADRNEILVGGDDGLIAVFRLNMADFSAKDHENVFRRRVRWNGFGQQGQTSISTVQLFPISTTTFGRGLISQLNYCLLSKPSATEKVEPLDDTLQVFIVSRESKLAFYMSHDGLLQHAAYAAAHGGGDSALIASSLPRRAVPIYWRVGGDSSHIVSCLTNTSPQTMVDNVLGGIFAAYGDAQTMMLTRAHYYAPPTIVRRQIERVLDLAIQPSVSGLTTTRDEKSVSGESSCSSLAERFCAAMLRMRKNLLMVHAAVHQQSFTALAVTGDNAGGDSTASAYPCLASADQTGNVILNDMLLAAWPAIKSASRRQEDQFDVETGENSGGFLTSGESFEKFAVDESKRKNEWRNRTNEYKPLSNNNWVRRALLRTTVIEEEKVEGVERADDTKIISFCFYPSWNVEAMSQAEMLDRSRKDLEERVELMLGREDEIALRSVSRLTWCPSVAGYSSAVASADFGTDTEAAKPHQLLVFNEAGFMMLFDRNLL